MYWNYNPYFILFETLFHFMISEKDRSNQRKAGETEKTKESKKMVQSKEGASWHQESYLIVDIS